MVHTNYDIQKHKA